MFLPVGAGKASSQSAMTSSSTPSRAFDELLTNYGDIDVILSTAAIRQS